MSYSEQLIPHLYEDGNEKLNGLITRNKGNNLPGVIILPAWLGIDEEAVGAAIALQSRGYIALIADIYGEGNVPQNIEEAQKAAGRYKLHFEHYQKRISLALNELIDVGADPHKIAVIGYCFGGTGALEAVRGKLSVVGAVCIHGSLYKDLHRKNEVTDVKILVEHPSDDHTVSKEDYENFIHEMKESNADWQLINYGNSRHTFTNPQSPDYNKVMANRAWGHTLQFLEEVLK